MRAEYKLIATIATAIISRRIVNRTRGSGTGGLRNNRLALSEIDGYSCFVPAYLIHWRIAMTVAAPPDRLKDYYMARRNKGIEDFDFGIAKEVFLDVLNDTFDSMYRDMDLSFDELLVRPTEAVRFCAAIRDRFKILDIPEDLILRTMLNDRKHG
jgi:hypothetical protein